MSEKEKKDIWELAFGLIKTDDLVPSEQMKELAKKQVQGKITSKEIIEILKNKYMVKDRV